MAGKYRAAALALVAGSFAFAPLVYAEEATEATAATVDVCAPLAADPRASNSRRQRRRPGQDGAGGIDRLQTRELPCNPDKLEPWVAPLADLGPAVPDRWRIMNAFYQTNLLDPYNGMNPLKGDLPVLKDQLGADDWFFSILALSDTLLEPRQFPVPVGVATTTRPGSLDLIGDGDFMIFAQTFLAEFVLLKGDTAYKPPDWEFRFTPAFTYTNVTADERGLLRVDPNDDSNGGRKRVDQHLGIQALFVDKHLRNVSDRFDFDSIRVGIQPFNSDFRGFLFNDNQLGVRLFGNRDNNIFQYNLAWFRRLEKEINSGLNDVTKRIRDDDVFIANVYWQDMPLLGYQSQATVVWNRNREKGEVEFDDNGFIARPSSLLQERFALDYDIVYFGYSGDGHFDWLNVSTSFYYALGEQSSQRFPDAEDKVRAAFFALELSKDYDWIRPRLSVVWGSGDSDPLDGKAEGFDAIFENPQIAGADTSYWIRQTVPLIGGGNVALSGRNGLLNSLRSSKEIGQSNFINPGLRLLGVGADFDLMPHLRVTVNANQLWFDDTATLERFRQQSDIHKNIGQDLSVSMIYRPFVTQNVVVRLSAAGLVPGAGFDDLFGKDEGVQYSVLANISLTY
jgi:hypothetical protein